MRGHDDMAGQKGRVARCYRCVHTWKTRGVRRPRMCPRCRSRIYDVPRVHSVVLGRGLGIEEILYPKREAILRAARRYGVAVVWVFGSVRRREAGPASDVDLMVRWSRPHSLLDRVQLQEDLEKILGRRVEIVNEGGLHWAIEPQVEAEKVPL